MQDFEPGQLGKMLIFTGLLVVAAGILIMVLSKLGLFHLPGDIEFGGKNRRVFFPVVSCLVLSLVLTLILWVIGFFRK